MGPYRVGAIFKPKDTSAGRFMGRSVIYGADGEHETPYMTRYWFGPVRFHIFHRGDQDPDCHDHPWDFWTFPLRTYVEEVLTPIRDAVAEGREAPPVRYQRRQGIVRAFRLHYRPATYTHRVLGALTRFSSEGGQSSIQVHTGEDIISYMPVGTIPTIVWRSGIKRKWGFTKSDETGKWCWVPWKKYAYEGGKSAPCGDE